MTRLYTTIREELLPNSGSKIDKLSLWLDEKAHYAGYLPCDVLTLAYLEYAGVDEETGNPSYNVCNSEHFATSDLARAIKAFDNRLLNDPFNAYACGQLEEFAIPEGKEDEFPSHQYINANEAGPHLVYIARRLLEIEPKMRGWADDLHAISRLLIRT